MNTSINSNLHFHYNSPLPLWQRKPFGIKRNTWCQLCSLSPGSKDSKSSRFIPNTIKKPPVSSPVFWVWNGRRWVWNDLWERPKALISLVLSVKTVENKRTQAFWPESWKVVEMLWLQLCNPFSFKGFSRSCISISNSSPIVIQLFFTSPSIFRKLISSDFVVRNNTFHNHSFERHF